jgi:ferric-dicitrate binding protein FerR (iron transport regulator)
MSFIPDPSYQALIIKYLSGEISESESQQLRYWVDQDAEHEAWFEEMYDLWESLRQSAHALPPSAEDSWRRLKARISFRPDIPSGRETASRFSLKLALGIFALILLMAFFGYQVMKRKKAPDTPAGQEWTSSWDINALLESLEEDPDSAYKNGRYLNGKMESWDSLFVQKSADSFVLSLKKGSLILKTEDEQLLIRKGDLLSYDYKKGQFISLTRAEQVSP